MDSEGLAYERSEPGTGPTPVYLGNDRAAVEGWRRNTPSNIGDLVQAMLDYEEAKEDD